MKKPKGSILILEYFILIIITVIIVVVFKGIKAPSTPDIDLKATVYFTKRYIKITNNNSFDWKNIKFELNSGRVKNGYIYRPHSFDWKNIKFELNSGRVKNGYIYRPRITYFAGRTYYVLASQFAKKDGTRLDPSTTKPVSLFISCDTPRGKRYYLNPPSKVKEQFK